MGNEQTRRALPHARRGEGLMPLLTIDLNAIASNYDGLRTQFSGQKCAAVVKADAYGLGVSPVAKVLAVKGCDTFFVATLEEGIELRTIQPQARIFVFHGPYPGEEQDYAAHQLIPVLNHPGQIEHWNAQHPFALHIDTGMCRLGLSYQELKTYASAATHLPLLLISHLACANEPAHPKNAEQLERFRKACALLPHIPASLCNSSGIFLHQEFHFHLARPGCALYGITPVEGKNPMQPVVNLTAPIIQIRTLECRETVGYGATASLSKGAHVAIIQTGYADGYLRSASNQASVWINGYNAPVIGRVSMDMIAADVSGIPQNMLDSAVNVELINAKYTVNHLARDAGTIGYEIFTRLGKRIKRRYVGGI